MKKILLLSVLCLFALQINAQEYVDLGLPSGTKWKDKNESGFYDYDAAVRSFGSKLPTKDQLEELKDACTWSWTGSGYKVTGPNGQSITLSAAGRLGYESGDVIFAGETGNYWSYSPNFLAHAWGMDFYSGEVFIESIDRSTGLSVRLVQD